MLLITDVIEARQRFEVALAEYRHCQRMRESISTDEWNMVESSYLELQRRYKQLCKQWIAEHREAEVKQ